MKIDSFLNLIIYVFFTFTQIVLYIYVMHIFEENIKKLDLNIPDMPTPLANYVPYKVSDSTVYVSGQGPVIDGKILYSG